MKYFALLFSVVLFFVFSEALITIFDYVRDGQFISPATKIEANLNKVQHKDIPALSNGPECSWTRMFKPHPYLFYAKKSQGDCIDKNINSQGFRGPEYPLYKLEKIFTIMVTGASVAEDQMGNNPVTTLESRLNRDYTIKGFDRFKVLVGATAGTHQPSQMIMLSLYSSILHGVISIDGYNEFELIKEPLNRMAAYPTDLYAMQGVTNTSDAWRYFFASCDGTILKSQSDSKVLSRSRTYFYVTELMRRGCRYGAQRLVKDSSPFASYFTFPEGTPVDEQRAYNEKAFLNYRRNMSAIAKASKMKELYILQPVPVFKKIMSIEEKLSTPDTSYGKLYKAMEAQQLALNAEGIPVISFVNLFDAHPERTFVDFIHMTDAAKGILEDRIVGSLEKYWHIERKAGYN